MVNDLFGIKLLYPSYEQQPEFFAFPMNSSQGGGDFFDKIVILPKGVMSISASGTETSYVVKWYEIEPEDGHDIMVAILSSFLTTQDQVLELPLDCDMNHTEANDRGYTIEENAEWRDVEMTSHFFVKSVSNKDGYLYFEARSGFIGKEKSSCCQDTAYGVELTWNNTDPSRIGTFRWYKRVFAGAGRKLSFEKQSPNIIIPSFYQRWFGVKFVIYSPERGDASTNPVVRLELWLTPITYGYPAHPSSNQWTRVGVIEDRPGAGWTDDGGECDAPEDDFPITWAAPFVKMGWKSGDVIQFANTSFREIDAGGTFGEDPEPDPGPEPDPDPPEEVPDPPPDAEPPLTPTTVTKRLTIRREILNNRLCSCDGQQPGGGTPPDGGGGGGTGGGGGGGTGTLSTLYNVALNTSSFARLASESNSSGLYLRFGQGVTQTNSLWIGKKIVRVEITIAEEGDPRGGTGGGVHCRIRKGTDDSIAATLSPVATEENIIDSGIVCVFENLTNNYTMVFGDKLLFEYDGGDRNNYIKIFRAGNQPNTGTKIVWQANDQDAGEYRDDADFDICARIYTITGTPTALGEDDPGTQ